VATHSSDRAGEITAEGGKSIGEAQTAFDAEIIAIQEALRWFRTIDFPSLIIHSDSTSAIACSGHTGAGPGQAQATHIHTWVTNLQASGRPVNVVWVKGHAGVPGNEEADERARQAAEKANFNPVMFIAYFKLKISDRFRSSKEK